MIADYWGIQRTVFSSVLDVEEFFGSQSHEEVLARAFYLVENNKPLGLLVGEQGVGKTFILKVLQHQALLSGRDVALLDLSGLDTEALCLALVEELRLAPRVDASRLEIQRLMQSYFHSLKLSHSQLVLLLDNFQLCEANCLVQLNQILNLSMLSNQCITTIIATEPVENVDQANWIARNPNFLMSLSNWSASETELYIEQALRNAGAQRSLFQKAAAHRIFQLTQGLPMLVKQLCEYSLILAADLQASEVSHAVVDEAARLMNLSTQLRGGSLLSSAVA